MHHPQVELAGPVTARERIVMLDVLRGFAILGILVMNVQSFGLPESAYINPTAYGDATGANFIVWLLGHVLAEQKFLNLFAMLFGAGVLLMTDRAERTGRDATRLHVRRMMWLAVFGLLHAYLLWYGDILFIYAVCGLAIYFVRKWSPWAQAAAGVVCMALPMGWLLMIELGLRFGRPEDMVELMNYWSPPPALLADELASYRGGWLEQMRHRAPMSFFVQTEGLLLWNGWLSGGLMLLGMALFQWGVLSGNASRRVYRGLLLLAAAVGVPVILLGVMRNVAAEWDLSSLTIGRLPNYWGSVLVTLGWISVIAMLVRRGWLRPLQHALAAVGRTALSNYLFQSVICTLIFYGHGLGWFGYLTRVELLGVVLFVWAVQIAITLLWLRAFRYGPMEWLWRSLSYGQAQPMRR